MFAFLILFCSLWSYLHVDWIPECANIENSAAEEMNSGSQCLVVVSKHSGVSAIKKEIRNAVLKYFVEKCVALKIPTSYKFVSNLLKFMYASPSGTGSMKKIEMEKQRLFRSAHCLEQRTYPPEVSNLVSTMHGIFESRLHGVLHVKKPEFLPSHRHSSAHVA